MIFQYFSFFYNFFLIQMPASHADIKTYSLHYIQPLKYNQTLATLHQIYVQVILLTHIHINVCIYLYLYWQQQVTITFLTLLVACVQPIYAILFLSWSDWFHWGFTTKGSLQLYKMKKEKKTYYKQMRKNRLVLIDFYTFLKLPGKNEILKCKH